MTLELSNTDIKTESNNNIKNIIWDFDGTLVDTYPVMAKSLLKAKYPSWGGVKVKL